MRKIIALLLLAFVGYAGQEAYVSSEAGGDITIIDVETEQVLKVLTVGGMPSTIALAPDGRFAYVANQLLSVVHIIDTVTRSIVKNLAVGMLPLDVVFTPDGAKAFSVNEGTADVTAIDTQTQTVSALSIPVGMGPFIADISADNTKLVVPNRMSDNVTILHPLTNAEYANSPVAFPVGSRPGFVRITPDSTKAVVANQGVGANSITFINLANPTFPINTIAVGTGPFSIVMTNDGATVYTFNTGS